MTVENAAEKAVTYDLYNQAGPAPKDAGPAWSSFLAFERILSDGASLFSVRLCRPTRMVDSPRRGSPCGAARWIKADRRGASSRAS